MINTGFQISNQLVLFLRERRIDDELAIEKKLVSN
jgi:hypothetical protein